MCKNQFTVYELQRQEYTTESTYLGEDSNGNSLFDTQVIYTGKVTTLLHKDKKDLIKLNNIPAWKAVITAQYLAEKGHTNKGKHVYDIHRTPITILN